MTTATKLNMSQLGAIAGSGYTMGHTEYGTHEFDHGIDIRVTPATGGYIISINQRQNYGQRPELHIVTIDQDLGAEIGKIITISCLKKEQ